MESKNFKVVYTITERGDKTFWTRIGVAYVNRDGSMNIKLDAVPVNGTMHVRDWSPRDEQGAGMGRGPSRGNGGSSRGKDDPSLDDLPDNF